MKYGICGYGNLGKAVERKILKSGVGDEIVGIFSRREGVESVFGSKVFKFDEANNFKGKIDAMLMCGGSQEDLVWQTPEMLKTFDVVDTFDTHKKIVQHRQKLDAVARANSHTAIYSCGWDPGIFSVIRVLAKNIFDTPPQTFWGKGVSQGHSEALRNIRGVADAVEFTIPNKEILQQVKNNLGAIVDDNEKHERHCFVALDGTRQKEEIVEEIRQTEDYFKGQRVSVEFCSTDKLKSLKENMHHKGTIFCGDADANMNFRLTMRSNPDFTARIMLAYSCALPKLESGAYSPLDVPLGMIGKTDNQRLI